MVCIRGCGQAKAALFAGAIVIAAILSGPRTVVAQSVPGGTCRPVSERSAEVGCWIIAHDPVGKLPETVFWYLDRYPTRELADAAARSHGIVVESLGAIWLFTIEGPNWPSSSGERVARIGPLPISTGHAYQAQYMEAIFTPGMVSATHTHSGPEAWYTEAGETCLETPAGAQTGRKDGPPVIVPGGVPMHLTATGSIQRRAIVLIIHDSSLPSTALEHDWVPKGLCKN
jgi:quercetin dioxygenase-like cupin family protein